MTSSTGKLVIAAAIAACGIVVCFRALRHTAPVNIEVVPAALTGPADTLRTDQLSFDRHPNARNVDQVIAEITDRVRQAAAELPLEWRLDEHRADALAQATKERLEIVLPGSYEMFFEACGRFGFRPDINRNGDVIKNYADRWEQLAKPWKYADVSLEHTHIRPVFIRGREYVFNTGGTIRSVSRRGKYPLPDDLRSARLDVYEVRVPLRVKIPEPEGDQGELPIFFSIVFGWNSDEDRWIPHRACLYDHVNVEYVALPPII